MSENMCSCNRSRDYDALLERYEKLERVAKKLYMHAQFMQIRTGGRHDCIIMRHAKRELEELGVIVDD